MMMMIKRSVAFALCLTTGLVIFGYMIGDLQPIFAQMKISPKSPISNATTTTTTTTSNATGIIGKNITIPTIDVNNTLLGGRATPITNTTPINSSK